MNEKITLLIKHSRKNLACLNFNLGEILECIKEENIEEIEILYRNYCVYVIKMINSFEKLGG